MDREKIQKLKKSKPFRPMDFVMFALVIVAIILSYALLFFKTGSTVEIWINGEMTKYALGQNQTIVAEDNHIVIVIQDYQVWVSYADCPDHLCIRQGRISRVHQSIACIPNNVVINIKDEHTDLDIIS